MIPDRSAEGGRIVEIVTTVADEPQAQGLVRTLLASRLVACGRWRTVSSAYRWNDRIELADEYEVTLKTTLTCAGAAEALLRDGHAYDVPMILRIPVESVNGEYAEWVRDSCRPMTSNREGPAEDGARDRTDES